MVACALGCSSTLSPPTPDVSDLSRALRQATGAEMVPGNSLELVENGAVFDVMERDINAAQKSVHIVMYIWRGEGDPSARIGDALLRRREGVACRIVVDPFGSLKFSRALQERLTASGCAIRRFSRGETAGLTARNHRKIQIVDGRIGLTGGWGIWRSWLGGGQKEDEWRDTAVRAEGAVVRQMQAAFAQSWVDSGGEPLPPDAFPEARSRGPTRAAFIASTPRGGTPSAAERMTHIVAASAKRQLWIANSYFIPDDRLSALLARKRRAGVDVRVLAPGPVHDVPPVRAAQRATYADLIQAGVRIFEYQPSMMHSKTMLVDGHTVVIGSTNIDQLSFDHLEEGSLVAEAPLLARKVQKNLEADFARSKEITREIWDNRDWLPEVGRRASSLIDDWL
jgi:cardiolipin synthase